MNEWIHVKDDRPRVGDVFLIWVDPDLVFSHCAKGWPCETTPGISISREIPTLCTHWMHLPEPPND
jgi:hypothetical protein